MKPLLRKASALMLSPRRVAMGGSLQSTSSSRGDCAALFHMHHTCNALLWDWQRIQKMQRCDCMLWPSAIALCMAKRAPGGTQKNEGGFGRVSCDRELGALKEVAREDELNASKWKTRMPYFSRPELQLLKQLCRYHAHFVDDQHLHEHPSRVLHRLNMFCAQAEHVLCNTN